MQSYRNLAPRPLGRQLFGLATFRGELNALAREALRGTCLVDGAEIEQCFYIDTEAGIVKTYDLRGVPSVPESMQDGKPHHSRELLLHWSRACWQFGYKEPVLPEIEAPLDGAVSRTIHGKVELFAAPPRLLMPGDQK